MIFGARFGHLGVRGVLAHGQASGPGDREEGRRQDEVGRRVIRVVRVSEGFLDDCAGS